ncbi:hypothetical protein Acife_0718 [Acidithiobacillus ferrivorans SS3]|uniref:Uncharacterized protein n=1 Tax=Acidithiobacillus ferrivorans SS3 TaxID=743299 RepID=G0JLG4_9PROT|nr:hypothetical protein [Acidithiobacillus ferrivorans]AEM46916.1 hypothetical protein Acife_0718 [Acidithiobacillus ferrivorans SS3]OFA16519.1 hypothetical protein A4U49_07005 [Acidithiobacillus ferrivorans]
MDLLDDIEGWAAGELGYHRNDDQARNLRHLMARIDDLKDKGLIPDHFPPGSIKRQLAEYQVRSIERQAAMLGYLPAAQELVMEAAKEVVREHLRGQGVSDALEKDSGLAQASDASADSTADTSKGGKKKRGSLGLGQEPGFAFTPGSPF